MPAKERKKVISAKRITRYAKICATHNRLEKLRYSVRDVMLAELDQGYVPATTGPFVLSRTCQRRVNGSLWSWKMVAMELAIKYFMATQDPDAVGSAMKFIVDQELNAPRKDVDVLQAKPNSMMLEEFLRSM